MKIARSVSAFHEGTIEYSKQEGELKNAGMMLKEHRRCYDKIVRYYNDLIYDGALVQKLGTPQKVTHSKSSNMLTLLESPLKLTVAEETWQKLKRLLLGLKRNEEKLTTGYEDKPLEDKWALSHHLVAKKQLSLMKWKRCLEMILRKK